LWRASRRLVVLAYHEVSDTETFAHHVDYLRTRMHPVSLAEVTAALGSGRALPRRAVLITFDDGDRTVYEHALPVLRECGVPAVAFVIAGLMGTDAPLWWLEVEELVRRGATAAGLPPDPTECVRALKAVRNEERLACIGALRRSTGGPPTRMPQLQPSEVAALESGGTTIGNHTFTHPCLDRCNDDTLESEIRRAHESLTDILGNAPTAFAYPNGNGDQRAVPILADLGYQAAFLFDHRIGPFPPRDRYRISRIRIDSTTPPNRFRIIVSGLHSSMHHLMGRA
jgi:peptidoglycan/xylan/chitin deacetylase (PgdA/CDA1 family)